LLVAAPLVAAPGKIKHPKTKTAARNIPGNNAAALQFFFTQNFNRALPRRVNGGACYNFETEPSRRRRFAASRKMHEMPSCSPKVISASTAKRIGAGLALFPQPQIRRNTAKSQT